VKGDQRQMSAFGRVDPGSESESSAVASIAERKGAAAEQVQLWGLPRWRLMPSRVLATFPELAQRL